ncbi:hypothetical protein [Candidatus Clavichlamydia salmonicola]|uniref:hypothetical protein n=1 Tax=Candidatus Clavichlamydia salmonicola TaxID=469812 RepID=UPI001890DAC1|nr:hypothetical protein [Candidatus Clavichlamydia salmonicola]
MLKFFEECFIKSWWVFLFFLFTSSCYEPAALVKKKETIKLKKKATYLHNKIIQEMKIQEKLATFLDYKEFPSWIEWALINYLGMVPEGYKKVILPSDIDRDKL